MYLAPRGPIESENPDLLMLSETPIQELQSVADAVIRALGSVASFHDRQMALFERLTPAAIEAGRAAEISAAIQRDYQPLIDAMVAPAKDLLRVLEHLNRSLDT